MYSYKKFNWNFTDGIILFLKDIGYQVKLSARYWVPPFELLVGDVLETSKSMQISAIVMSCKLELDDKNLLLKTSHILVTRLGLIRLVLAGSFLLLLAFKVVKVLFVML